MQARIIQRPKHPWQYYGHESYIGISLTSCVKFDTEKRVDFSKIEYDYDVNYIRFIYSI